MTRKRKRSRAGFTLVELIIALSISSIVLIGVFSMLSSMVQYEAEGLRKGSVNGWSLASLVAMNGEIEAATVLVYPLSGGQSSLVVCSNWSRLSTLGVGGPMNTFGGGPGVGPTVYSYCWEAPSDPGQNGGTLLRQVVSGNCPALGYIPPACSPENYGADSVIATGVYQDAANDPIFTADPTMAGTVRLRYIVGKPTSGVDANEGNGTTNFANPQSMAFDTRLTLDQSMGLANTVD